MSESIKLFDPVIGVSEKNVLIRVLKSKFWASGSGVGAVSRFENEFKKFVQSNSCIAVNSGTAALFMGLKQIDINNCEIIVPSMTFVATSNSIVHAGGIPHFVDCEKNDLNIDPVNLEKHLADTTIIKKNVNQK